MNILRKAETRNGHGERNARKTGCTLRIRGNSFVTGESQEHTKKGRQNSVPTRKKIAEDIPVLPCVCTLWAGFEHKHQRAREQKTRRSTSSTSNWTIRSAGIFVHQGRLANTLETQKEKNGTLLPSRRLLSALLRPRGPLLLRTGVSAEPGGHRLLRRRRLVGRC